MFMANFEAFKILSSEYSLSRDDLGISAIVSLFASSENPISRIRIFEELFLVKGNHRLIKRMKATRSRIIRQACVGMNSHFIQTIIDCLSLCVADLAFCTAGTDNLQKNHFISILFTYNRDRFRDFLSLVGGSQQRRCCGNSGTRQT